MPRHKNSTPTRLSDAVAALRKRMGLTQPQFAALLKVTLVTVARWETTRPPSGDTLIVLRRLSSKLVELFRKSPAHDNATEERALLDIDDTFYSALVQEFPFYRFGLVVSIKSELNSVRMNLLNAAVSESTPPGLKALLDGSDKALQCIDEMVTLFNPLIPVTPTKGTAEDVADELMPMVMKGTMGTAASDASIRKETQIVKRRIRRDRDVTP